MKRAISTAVDIRTCVMVGRNPVNESSRDDIINLCGNNLREFLRGKG